MSISQYFEKRQKTYPQNVKGKFRTIKNAMSWVCLIIYLLSPFLRWDRGASAPNQAILIDIPHSRAYFFFIEIWPEETYYLAGILIFAAIALFFVTSLFGRVWCGYSCPQTVWTDLFIKTERFFQGDRNQRIILDRKTFSLQNIWRKTATHLSWIIISLVTGLGFSLYFSDAFTTIKNLVDLNLSWTILGWILGIATSTYIMAGFAREQVCNYMCPYARFQSAMFDQNTLIVSYDQKRGEPRGKYKQSLDKSSDKLLDFNNRGHCIDCKQCVVVCPQNIDIRNGLQMECIACGLCIDACNNVMEQIGLPKGLIRYDTEINLNNTNPTKNTKFRILRPRTFVYTAVLLLTGGLLLFKLSFRSTLEISVLPDRNPMFVVLSNGNIRNGYTIKIANKTHQNKSYSIKISGINDLEIKTECADGININNLPVKAETVDSFKIYVNTTMKNLSGKNGQDKLDFTIIDNQDGTTTNHDSVFISK